MPIWDALPEELRGRWVSLRDEPLLVAGWSDAVDRRPVALVDHGVGQTYEGVTSGSYNGGRDRWHIGCFLYANERACRINRARYPDAMHAVVGSPAMDRWHIAKRVENERPVVAVAWHWNCGIAPETRWALPYYQRALPGLVSWAQANDVELVGHGHPRAEKRLKVLYAKVGIPWATYDEVLGRADVLVMDNSSLMYEAGSVGIAVVALNCPRYRTSVEHGLRFWSHVPGIEVNGPEELIGGIESQLAERWVPDWIEPQVFAFRDGKAALRAAEVLEDWLTRP